MNSARSWLSAVATTVLFTITLGIVWGLVDWLRSGGVGISPFPWLEHSLINSTPFRRQLPGTFLGMIEDIINWHNLTFRGATRFGSTLGMIAGAFVSLKYFTGFNLVERTLAGAIAGGLIGGRAALILGSGVGLFLTGLTTGAIVGALYMALAGGQSKLSSLPDLPLKKID